MYNNKMLSYLLLVLLSFFFIQTSSAQTSGSQNWNGWSFNYQVSGAFDGLSLTNVTYQGVTILNKASFPVMRVFYDNNVCGPYADRLGGTLTPVSWANNAQVVLRQFDQGGRTWLELGIQDTIGNYIIYQAWYLSTDGILDGHLFSKGLQCNIDHIHYPYWRMDFDLDGENNDQIRRNVNGSWQTYSSEFNANATAASNHQWQIRDTVSDYTVDVQFGATGWTGVPGATEPSTSFANNQVFGRRYRSSEDTGWTYGASAEVPFNNGESINGQDIVFWYKGYLPHAASDGPNLWHSTGVRFVLNIGGSSNNPPTISSPGTQTNDEGDTVGLGINASDSDGDTLSYSASGLPAALSINASTGTISGNLALGSAGTYNVTVTVSDGQATASTNFSWVVNNQAGTTTILYDFESGAQGWTTDPNGTDTATTGEWERTNPETTSSGGSTLQLGTTVSGQFALVTDGRAGSSVGTYDIDGGVTSTRSPSIDLTNATQASLSFSYYLAHLSNASSADFLRVKVVGNNTTTVFEELGAGNVDAASWQSFNTSLNAFLGQTIYLLIEAADAGSSSLVEAGVDDVAFSLVVPAGNQAPVITNPGDQTNDENDTVSLQIAATDADGDPLSYSATNLPAGLSINPNTGLISGTIEFFSDPSYATTVSVSDGTDNDSVSFTWTVNSAPPPPDDLAEITSPAPNSILTGSDITFTWTDVGADQYWLEVGASQGSAEYGGGDQGTATSATITGLPTDGSTVHVRLWTIVGFSWQNNDYQFTSGTGGGGGGTGIAEITSPSPDSTLSGDTVTFNWTDEGADQYWLEVGASPGSAEYFGGDQGSATSATVTGLPTDGSTVYVRLWTVQGFSWQANSYQYTASSGGGGGGSGNAAIISPTPGSTLPGSTVTFQWSDVGADQYWVEIGISPGSAEYGGGDQGTNTSITITDLPTDGSTVHVRLWTIRGFGWFFEDYQFTAP